MTGTEMLTFGPGGTAAYNPATNTWHPVSATGFGMVTARDLCGPIPDALNRRSRLAPRRLLVPERDSAGHQAGERGDLQHGSYPVRQGLAEQHEPGGDRDRVGHHRRRAITAFGDRRWDSPACMLPVDYLLAVGFKTVRPHHHYPWLRMELRTVLT